MSKKWNCKVFVYCLITTVLLGLCSVASADLYRCTITPEQWTAKVGDEVSFNYSIVGPESDDMAYYFQYYSTSSSGNSQWYNSEKHSLKEKEGTITTKVPDNVQYISANIVIDGAMYLFGSQGSVYIEDFEPVLDPINAEFVADHYDIKGGDSLTLSWTITGGKAPFTIEYAIWNGTGFFCSADLETNEDNTQGKSTVLIPKDSDHMDFRMEVHDSEGTGCFFASYHNMVEYDDPVDSLWVEVDAPTQIKAGSNFQLKYDITGGTAPYYLLPSINFCAEQYGNCLGSTSLSDVVTTNDTNGTISCHVPYYPGATYCSIDLTVEDAEGRYAYYYSDISYSTTDTINIEKIVVEQEKITVDLSQITGTASVKLNAKVYPENATNAGLLEWYTTNYDVAYPSDGTLYIIGPGEADIYCNTIGREDLFASVHLVVTGHYTGWVDVYGGYPQYFKEDGSHPQTGEWLSDDGKWYYFDNNDGFAHIGWLDYGGNWYYMKADGSMAVNEVLIIDGKRYAFNEFGFMLKNTGEEGWVNKEGKWYYYEAGTPVTGWQELANTWYHFSPFGVMQTGWLQDGDWYYFDQNGRMVTGWQNIAGSWYYFSTAGKMITGWQSVGGSWYYFNAAGKMITGWQSVDGSWYYFNAAGKMVTGWQNIGNAWYWFDTNGVMVTGIVEISGKQNQFDANGVWQGEVVSKNGWTQEDVGWVYYSNGSKVTGWKQIDGSWYYFNGNGSMKTGWLQDGGSWYYFQNSGKMVADTTLTINGVDYTFAASGVMQ